jgi:hypothetical protein
VILESRQLQRGRWPFTDWRLVGVIPMQADGDVPSEGKLIHTDAHSRQYLWSNLGLRLYRDAAESYWYNLTGQRPQLYVICGRRGEHELAPLLVTANYDEAAAHMETDSKVFSASIPAEIYRWLEAYVLENFEPPEDHRRERENWSDDGRDNTTSQP